MNEEEAADFEADPLFDLSIQMRKWDELAKEKNVRVIDLAYLKRKAQDVLRGG